MDYNTIFVGMDVHKENFSLCCYSIEKDEFSHPHTTAADYKHVLAYIASLRGVFGEDAVFLCGYEAGCLGFTLYHQLTEHNVNCVVLAPTTMPVVKGNKKSRRISGMRATLQNVWHTMTTALYTFPQIRMSRSKNIFA